MSDFYHVRKFPILVAMIIFSVASLGSSFVNNIWALVVLRCIQSAGSSCGQSVCAGVIADCYPLEKRGSAFGKFFFGMFIGPLLGPIVGGFLIMSPIGWRSTFWFCFALGIFIFVLCFCCLPETYRDNEKFDKELPVVTDSKSAASSATDVQSIPEKVLIKRKNINPIAPFLLLRHPFVFLASFVSGIAFGSMFAIETVIPEIYEKKYGFSSWQTGLSFLGAGVGNFLGSSLNGYLSDRLLMRARAKRGGQAMVEDRLTANLWPAGIFFIPLGLLMFGFMAEYQVSVWGSIVGFGIQCFGMNMLLTSTSAYLVDAMPGQGASATAAGVLVRMTMSCVLTLVANPMVAALGIGYTTVLLSGLSLLSMVMLLVLKMRGEQLRRWSGYA
ncbi:major facilitator superfamily domain-containing protein [Radiomyces spectabilis]|uniref:major facilitator superfamily domain-containing protein n=1 Tax=Radiomyces spectabilis TaxID=64574 RepID=UPI00221E6D89|nr:major facilitator superfamily domain-containing protein [Radiomyces spectabilis]KAI8372798.1 major facilitator superfamily domain-containing protein [Radiomyces spectabilis]